MKIGTLTTGAAVVTTINLNYLPERINYTAATQLTGLKVEVLGEGVKLDLDANGLTAVGKHRMVGRPTNGYSIPVADGLILNKNVVLTFTNSAAQTPDIFAFADNTGSIFINTSRQKVFANTNAEISKFGVLFLPSLAAGDKVTITYEDGTSQIYEREDLAFLSGQYQNVTAYQIDNLAGTIKKVNILTAADQSIYLTKFEA